MCDAVGGEAWSYDQMGRVVADKRTTNGVTVQTNYVYNQAGGVTQLTYPFTGTQIVYTYNAAGRAVKAVGGMNYVTGTCPTATGNDGACYTPGGALASAKYGESGSFAMVGAYTFNNRLQPNRMKIERTDATGCLDDPSAPGAGCILDFVYNFDADSGTGVANNGNVAGITNRRNTARSQTFTYDELNRIKTAEVPTDWGLSFGYDIWANLLSQTVTKGSAYPLSVAANDKNQIIGFCYYAAGNLVHQGACPGSSYTYDAENRMVTAGGMKYLYDGDGRRVTKCVPDGQGVCQVANSTVYWHEVSGQVLVETDLAGVFKRQYIYFKGSRVARHDAGGNWFYFADHLGSARVMTWQNGAPVEESDYYPFGGERVILDTVGAPWDNNRKFTGQERDTESGLDYFIARHYASTLGRFLQPDPKAKSAKPNDPQTWNRYSYVGNNPLGYVDPNGRERLKVTLTTTIPSETVREPLFGRVFNGGPKTQHTVVVETDPRKSPNPEQSKSHQTFPTKLLDDAGNTKETRKADESTLSEGASRNTDGSVNVNFEGNAKMPFNPLAPGITYNINVTCEGSTCTPTSGEHDGFPAYKIEVTNEAGKTTTIYEYDPNAAGKGPRSLAPPAECKVGTSSECAKGQTPKPAEIPAKKD